MDRIPDWLLVTLAIIVVAAAGFGGIVGAVALVNGVYVPYTRNVARDQRLLDEQNEVEVNNIRIRQQEQLIQVEQQKAQIRVEEAKGIAQAQQIINATLTDKYLTHEAIQAQVQMAESPNHTTVYLPVGPMGVPLVRDVGADDDR